MRRVEVDLRWQFRPSLSQAFAIAVGAADWLRRAEQATLTQELPTSVPDRPTEPDPSTCGVPHPHEHAQSTNPIHQYRARCEPAVRYQRHDTRRPRPLHSVVGHDAGVGRASHSASGGTQCPCSIRSRRRRSWFVRAIRCSMTPSSPRWRSSPATAAAPWSPTVLICASTWGGLPRLDFGRWRRHGRTSSCTGRGWRSGGWRPRRSIGDCRRCAVTTGSPTSTVASRPTRRSTCAVPEFTRPTQRGMDRGELAAFLYTAERISPAHAALAVSVGPQRPTRQ